MNFVRERIARIPNLYSQVACEFLVLCLLLSCMQARCNAQGTTTFRFEGQPLGMTRPYTSYVEAGMQFGVYYGPGSMYLSGGGVAGYPDNGTGYLYMPDGNLTQLTFGFNVFPPSNPLTLFSLVSFDVAEYAGLGSGTLVVVGYKPMAGTVTSNFTLDGINDGTGPLQDFQTFYFDSQFANVYRVDVFGLCSLDNLVISGVPEPSAGALLLLGTLCVFGCTRRILKRP